MSNEVQYKLFWLYYIGKPTLKCVTSNGMESKCYLLHNKQKLTIAQIVCNCFSEMGIVKEMEK